jgi:WhiB family redox-sensing transcriptional regulator
MKLEGADNVSWRWQESGPTTWYRRAACQGYDPELFFAESKTGSDLARLEAAKRICRECPVRNACLRWAIDNGASAGVWGGTDARERRVLRGTPMPRQRELANQGQE